MSLLFAVIFMFQLFTLKVLVATKSSIVGGKESKPHSRPYMASLQFGNHHSCGGILIRKDFVLTAAHCNRTQQEMTVVLGAHNISKKEKSQQHIPVSSYYIHPNFSGHYDYDIMLLKLKKYAALNKYVKPIELPKKNGKTPANVKCKVAGWGKTVADDNMPFSKVLKETTEEMQFSFECNNVWEQYIPARMICTKFTKRTGGVCQGDSGGPLICNTKPQGITAFTEKVCDNPKYPHVFTKINFFLPWINKIIKLEENV